VSRSSGPAKALNAAATRAQACREAGTAILLGNQTAAARVQARREAGTATLFKAKGRRVACNKLPTFARREAGTATSLQASIGEPLTGPQNRSAPLKTPEFRQISYDRNSTVIINLSGIRIFLKTVASLHKLTGEDGLELLALPPARFQLPSSLELPVIPSRKLRALLKRICPWPPGQGLFLWSVGDSVVPTLATA
jgi:hypothetical protein